MRRARSEPASTGRCCVARASSSRRRGGRTTGMAQLEALADGCLLVTTPAPGPYAALPIARELDPRLVGEDLAAALRAALDDPRGRLRRARGGGAGAVPAAAVDAIGRRGSCCRGCSLAAAFARLRSRANSVHGRVLAICSGPSQARRAVAIAAPHVLERLGAVGVGVDRGSCTPACRGRARVDVVEVAAVRRGVDLEHRAGAGRGLDDRVDVDLVGLARARSCGRSGGRSRRPAGARSPRSSARSSSSRSC